MALDHLVIRTPQRRRLLNDLADRFNLQTLQGFKSQAVVFSEGVRFRNGPFIDVFDWPLDKAPFDPLLAIQGNIGSVQQIAVKNGWNVRLHKREDIPADDRPPWSTLSFARGQGLISSIFIIEYEDATEAWAHEQFNGLLYDRSGLSVGDAELCRIDVNCTDINNAQSQLDAVLATPIPLLNLQADYIRPEGVGAIHIRPKDGPVLPWLWCDFDSVSGA
ncbi:MAG: hypothetical protein K2X59_09805 [Sphingomonas sp.]|nr:hypothetical protein [Sphingomonas sp.]